MSVRYTRDALRDLDQISSYIARQNVKAAADLLAAIETVVARLERFPRSAPMTETSDVFDFNSGQSSILMRLAMRGPLAVVGYEH